MAKKRVLSGMRPTGRLHIGHLVGALDNWLSLQEEYECFFMAADWHALMSEYENAKGMSENIIDNVLDWLACGIDPDKSVIFVQSEVQEHLNLYMLFSILTPLGWLERCPTYKEQLQNLSTRQLQTHAFIGYPVLQAADILIYKAQVVPVGEDQIPHLELTREIVRRANHYFGLGLPEPQALLTKTPRLPGTDGRKMSKSYGNTISLSESDESLLKKVRAMITDPARIKKTDKGHPSVCSVFLYHQTFSDKASVEEIERECKAGKIGCVECKKRLYESLLLKLAPLRKRRRAIETKKDYVRDVLNEGREKAKAVASKVWEQIDKKVFDGLR